MARVLPLKQRDPGSMPGEPTNFITLWCNGSTLNESDPVKDTFSTKFQSTHKGADGVRFPGALPFKAAVV